MSKYQSQRADVFARAALLSVSTLALGLGVALAVTSAQAQQAAPEARPGAAALPQVSVDASRAKPRPKRAAQSSRTRAPVVAQPAAKPADTHDARTGTVGYYANSTSVATKSNTPLLNIPQTVNVVTKDFIKDQAFQNITDISRYVPGVTIHQGEGNRDELVIRGVDSSANFFVNGMRDDVQYFRDLYNTQSIEVLKGPSALTFGRGAGGGLVNRTLKEADGRRIYEATVQSGSFGDRRISLDAGQAISQDFAVRLNAFYEGADTFRDFGKLERYGINPTVTFTPTDDTKVKLSYEYYHDKELADRGNPSVTNGTPTPARPTIPFVPNGDYTKFFGSPIYNNTYADVQTTMAVVEHDFHNGLTVKNSSMYADFNRGYTNVYPGTSAPNTPFFLSAYQNTTNRENAFNQTDFTYKTAIGSTFHTIGFGTEFGRQTGLSFRSTGIFAATGTNKSQAVDPFNPTYFGTVNFIHHFTNVNNGDGVSTADAFSKYKLNVQSGYVRDTVDVTRWLQLIGGVRYDRFDLSALDQNFGVLRSRVDEKLSPSGAVIIKPMDNLSLYYSYMVSYLPASGDQFSALAPGTAIIDPQKFENNEIGLKWNINPRLQYTAAIYNLDRTNVPLAVGNGLYALSGKNTIKGFETTLGGYVTDDLQTTLGYAYTDARIASDTNSSATSTTVSFFKGNRIQLVPYNQFSLWNKYQYNYNWAAGVGIIYLSDSYASSDDTVKLPGFVRVDAGLYYKYNEQWSGQLSVQNVFDKGYWASADGNNNISPGAPRTFRVSATSKF